VRLPGHEGVVLVLFFQYISLLYLSTRMRDYVNVNMIFRNKVTPWFLEMILEQDNVTLNPIEGYSVYLSKRHIIVDCTAT
jgi:hypothetical protein